MANPAEFHTMMYEFFYNGNLPVERKSKDGKSKSTVVTPKKAMDAFEELMAMQRDPERVAKREAALKAKLAADAAKTQAPSG